MHQTPLQDLDISLYSQTELFSLRQRIDALLPEMDINKIDLEEEVVRQFMTVKNLQSTVLQGAEEANKKAAVINACTAALAALAKMQVELHTAERFKKIENLMIRYIKLMPKELAEQFLEKYTNLELG
jgi:hypothetical protein